MTPPPLPKADSALILTTADRIEGSNVTRNLGIVRGNSVQTTGMKGAFTFTGGGGEIAVITHLHDTTQQQAERAMILKALVLGADAVIAVRYQVVAPSSALYGVMCYGTAVKTNPVDIKDG
jgi:uncharacterized protein YbjQ (UPF0145 family)